MNALQTTQQQQPKQDSPKQGDWFGAFLKGFTVVAGCTALVMAVYETAHKYPHRNTK